MCGDFNGDSDDEFTDKFGDQTDLVSFQKSWSQGKYINSFTLKSGRISRRIRFYHLVLIKEYCVIKFETQGNILRPENLPSVANSLETLAVSKTRGSVQSNLKFTHFHKI